MGGTIDPKCHIGETHGIYTIVDVLDKKDKYSHWIYKSVCNECGYELFSHYGQVAGKTKQVTKCRHIRISGHQVPSGQFWGDSRIANIFNGMVTRCYNPNDKTYQWYGQKGIEVCQEWLNNPKSFEEWALNSGYSNDLTIDRIDANNDYCPSNCRWIPLPENTRRAGKVNWITINDITLTGRQWAEKLGLGLLTIDKYIRDYGLDLTTKLILAMLKEPPSTLHRKSHQTWFAVYGIQT
jgi:hypothetical protein